MQTRFSNITGQDFWNNKYLGHRKQYYLVDPLYGRNGVLARTLLPWTRDASTLVELGCGSSRYLMFFNQVAGLQTFGIDFSAEGLQGLQQMARPHGAQHTLFLGDMFQHDLQGHKFDIVFHAGLVEHFADMDLFFRRCRFFCKDDGLMIFFMPNMQNHAWSWHKRLCPANYQAHILYTKEQVIKALEPYFALVEVCPWGFPQLYAGGSPESLLASLVKCANLALMLCVAMGVPGYQGKVNARWASLWLLICRPANIA